LRQVKRYDGDRLRGISTKSYTRPGADLANRDFLTGLPNGWAFYNLAGRQMEQAFGLEPITLAFVDIQGFKGIKHRFGYATGEQILCKIARAIQESVPQPELVGPIGGTSFAVLLTNAACEEARFVSGEDPAQGRAKSILATSNSFY
jgi:diguanylate cyclase (GGDEF)-like protein